MKRPKGAPRAMYAGHGVPATPPGESPRAWGRKNLYVCDTCRGVIATEDVDEGVTPAFLACRADGTEDWDTPKKCKGTMQSQWYPPEPWSSEVVVTLARVVGPGGKVDHEDFGITPPEVTWEWYRPGAAKLRRADGAVRDHVERDGLLLRKKRPA